MERTASQTRRWIIAAVALFLAAGVLHEGEELFPETMSALSFMTVSAIYIILPMGWAISVRQRIMDVRLRRLLIATALLGVAWMIQRACKYRFFESDDIKGWLWYFSYLQQIFAPLLMLLAALELGRAEDEPLSRAWLLFVPAGVLFLGVMTNDLHQLAFRFPTDFVSREESYVHGLLYYLVVCWGVGITAAGMTLLFRKCSVAAGRRFIWLPCAVFAAGFLASLLSLVEVLTMYQVPELLCLTFIATWECCIQIGLVPSNTEYGRCFAASAVPAQIVDENGGVVFQSGRPLELNDGQRGRARDGAAFLDADTRLHCHPVHGGYVYWTDSVAQVNRIRRQLAEVGELLAEDNELVRAENEARRQQAQLEEQNRIYDSMYQTVRPQMEAIGALLDGLTPDAPDFQRRLGQVCVYGAYVKRRCNLALIQEAEPSVQAQELALCIRESINYLSDTGVAASFQRQGNAVLPPARIVLAYDFFEAAVEAALPALSALLVNLHAGAEGLTLKLAMEDARSALPPDWEQARRTAHGAELRVERQDGTLFAALKIGKAGDGE